MGMMKKSDIKNWREKLILGVGIGIVPDKITDINQRLLYRKFAIYILGKVLELPEPIKIDDCDTCYYEYTECPEGRHHAITVTYFINSKKERVKNDEYL